MTETPSEPVPWSRSGWLVVAVPFLVGLVNFPLQVVGTHLDHLPGDTIDNRLNNFILEHGYRYLTGKAESFWDAPSYFPRKGVTAWSDAHIGTLPCYAALRVLGLSPEGAFQGYFVVAVVLNFVAAAWALRRLGFRPVGVAAAAYLFAYSLPVVAQACHTQLQPRFLVPVAFVFAWEFLREQRTRQLAVVAACVAAQFYMAVYIGYFLAMMLTVALLVVLLRFPQQFEWRELFWPGWGRALGRSAVVVVAGVAMFPLLSRHYDAAGGGALIQQIKPNAPVPGSWLSVPENAYLHPDSRWSPLPATGLLEVEHLMCPGLLSIVAVGTVALLVFTPIQLGTTRSVAVASSWTALLLAVLVTRFGDDWLYEWLGWLPGVGGIRAPGRVCLVMPLLYGVAVAYLLDAAVEYAARFGRGWVVVVGVVCLAGVFAEQRLLPVEGNSRPWFSYRTPVAMVQERQERIAAVVRLHPVAKFVYVFPTNIHRADLLPEAFHGLALQAEVMRATQDLGVPCVNGWSGYNPAAWFHFNNYRELSTWLRFANKLPPERLQGLVIIGEPLAAFPGDEEFEARMRAAFPPQILQTPHALP